MKNKQSRLAFSLIELSIVILIIGILVLGITKGSRIIKSSKLKTAQSLTTSSPVNSIDNIVMWVEATLDKSLLSSEAVDTPLVSLGTISAWNDINPQATSFNSPTQSNGADKPRYLSSAINGLPALNFDGLSNFLNFNGAGLANSNYTVFVVEQRRGAGIYFFIGGADYATNQNLHLGYRDDVTLTFSQYANDYNVPPIPNYNVPTPRIHSYRFNSLIGKDYNINGVPQSLLVAGGTPVQTTGLTSFNGAKVGRVTVGAGLDYFYKGDIGEIIMFSKYLKDSERLSVENYLKTKWGIK